MTIQQNPFMSLERMAVQELIRLHTRELSPEWGRWRIDAVSTSEDGDSCCIEMVFAGMIPTPVKQPDGSYPHMGQKDVLVHVHVTTSIREHVP